MEFNVSHRLDRLVPLYDALWTERLGRATTVFRVLAVASMTVLLSWPAARWPALAVVSASVMAIALIGLARDALRRQIRGQYEALDLQQIRYRIHDEGLSETTAAGEGTLRWRAFAPPRELAGFLVLQRRPAGSGNVIALPLDQIGPEVRRAIEDRIAHATTTGVG